MNHEQQLSASLYSFEDIPEFFQDKPVINFAPYDPPKLHVVHIAAKEPLKQTAYAALKRATDIVIASLLLIAVFSWLAPVIALLIKLDSRGPVFFRQIRYKKGGKLFTCIKFRSMILNEQADSLSTMHNDYRITRAGRILRKYHLDELPQLLNVLAGHMSIVGPRPHMITENIRYSLQISDYDLRHQVKPGMTGLAQSLGYYGSTTEPGHINERLRLDLAYIRNWSFAMDVTILYRTAKMLFTKQA